MKLQQMRQFTKGEGIFEEVLMIAVEHLSVSVVVCAARVLGRTGSKAAAASALPSEQALKIL